MWKTKGTIILTTSQPVIIQDTVTKSTCPRNNVQMVMHALTNSRSFIDPNHHHYRHWHLTVSAWQIKALNSLRCCEYRQEDLPLPLPHLPQQLHDPLHLHQHPLWGGERTQDRDGASKMEGGRWVHSPSQRPEHQRPCRETLLPSTKKAVTVQ